MEKLAINTSLAGVWLDEANHGWRITIEAIKIIAGEGFPLSAEDQAAIDCHAEVTPCPGHGSCDCGMVVDEIYQEAENWINERTPDGYSFGFHEGSWYFQHEDWWQEEA